MTATVKVENMDGRRAVIEGDGYWPAKFAIRCPFHHELTASCVGEDVSRRDVAGKGSWTCFGCGRSGDWHVLCNLERGVEIVLYVKAEYDQVL